jgi:hypothetical protein
MEGPGVPRWGLSPGLLHAIQWNVVAPILLAHRVMIVVVALRSNEGLLTEGGTLC